MNILLNLLALSPVIFIFLLLTIWKKPADTAGWMGWLVTCLIAFLVFKTAPGVLLKASISGGLASLPVALVVATSIFQVTLMMECGAIGRIVATIKTIAPHNQVVQIMILI